MDITEASEKVFASHKRDANRGLQKMVTKRLQKKSDNFLSQYHRPDGYIRPSHLKLFSRCIK